MSTATPPASTTALTRDQLLTASLRGDRALIGPEVVWLDILLAGGEPAPVPTLERIIARLAAAGTRDVILGRACSPLPHPELPGLVQRLHASDLRAALRLSPRDAAARDIRTLTELPLRWLFVELEADALDADPAPLLPLDERPDEQFVRVDLRWPADRPDALEPALALATAIRANNLRLCPGPGWSEKAARSAAEAIIAAPLPLAYQGDGQLGPTPSPLDAEALVRARYVLTAREQELAGFRWDGEQARMICPAGRTDVRNYRNARRPGGVFVELPQEECERCALIHECQANHMVDRIELQLTQLGPLGLLLAPPRPGPCLLPHAAAWIDGRGKLWSCPVEQQPEPHEVGDLLDGDSWVEALDGDALRAWRRRARQSRSDFAFPSPCDQLAELNARLEALADAPIAPAARELEGSPAALRWAVAALRQRELRRAEQGERAHQQDSDRFELGRFVDKIRRRDVAIGGLGLEREVVDRKLRTLTHQGLRQERNARRIRRELQQLRFAELDRDQPVAPARKVDVLLVMPPPWGVDKPPLGAAFLAQYLRSHDVSVELWDLNVQFHNAALGTPLERLWAIDAATETTPVQAYRAFFEVYHRQMEALAERALRADIPIIGISTNFRNHPIGASFARLVKQQDPQRLTIYGGPEAFVQVSAGEYSDPYVDLYALGEGEEMLLEIARRHLSGGSLDDIPGVYRPGFTGTPTLREPPRDLDAIPFPTYSGLELADYESVQLPFLFSRGCINRCAYCMDHVLSPRYRCRSGEHAVAEMEHHIAHHDCRLFNFNDLVCNGDLRKLASLAELIVKRGLDVVWWSYATIRKGMTRELAELMRTAGCASVLYGFESGSDAVLAAMGKRYDAATAEQNLRDTARAGLETGINIIVGYPGEGEAEFMETVDFVRRNRDHIGRVINLSSLAIHAGSAISRDLGRYGISYREDGTWQDATGLDLELRNERIDRMLELLEELQLAPHVINREIAETLKPEQGC